ncbi:MAG TPA: hypothetical protein VNS49_22955, partial [Streptomyces sp.]|nr:hypothetical protein [Streptomyces sp.]
GSGRCGTARGEVRPQRDAGGGVTACQYVLSMRASLAGAPGRRASRSWQPLTQHSATARVPDGGASLWLSAMTARAISG